MVHILRWSLWADLNLRSSVNPREISKAKSGPLSGHLAIRSGCRPPVGASGRRPARHICRLGGAVCSVFGVRREVYSLAFQRLYLYKT